MGLLTRFPPRTRRLAGVASLLFVVIVVLAIRTLWDPLAAASGAPRPVEASAAVNAAWNQVRRAGRYTFSADISQEVNPQPTLPNAGRAGKTQRLYVEGETNLEAETLEMALWGGSGSVAQPESASRIRVAQGKTSVSQGDGTWEESEDLTSTFTPDGDFLTFLAAARNIRAASPAPTAWSTVSMPATQAIAGRSMTPPRQPSSAT